MDSLKPLQWGAIALGVGLVLFAVYTHLQYFRNVSFLGGILLIEVIIACLWKYDQRFFILLIVAFLWAGMHLPMQDAWTGGRWVVLSAGALIGFVVWMKAPRGQFRLIHLLAMFCVGAAFVSATVSPFVQMASFKAVSLLLLFLYCTSGARLAVLGREQKFFNGLLLGGEIVIYGTAICYFGLGDSIWGNPNSLGEAMSIGLFPIFLWGWLISEGPVMKTRRLAALGLCTYLIMFSMARAGMVAMVVVTIVFCLCLHQYKLLIKTAGLVLCLVAVTGMLDPSALDSSLLSLKDAVLYKGHKEGGVLGSRKTPWQNTISTIKAHPLFGSGYGTSPSGEDPGLYFGKFASSVETEREHGSSYMTIAEWVGLLGLAPFLALLLVTVINVCRVCSWMSRTSDPRHYAIPLAMVVLAGLVHANFEDWLFAVGAYPCVYFWVFAFVLADLVPARAPAHVSPVFRRAPAPPVPFGEVVSSSR